jgi:DNA mismatch repair ATPase MutL
VDTTIVVCNDGSVSLFIYNVQCAINNHVHAYFRKKRKRIAKEHSGAKTSSQEKKKVVDKESSSQVEKKKQKKEKEESSKKNSSKDKAENKASSPAKEPSNKEDDVSHVTKSENSAVIEAAKKEASNLKRRVERLYKKCVEEIEKLTKEHLPRKVKGGGTSKCQGEILKMNILIMLSLSVETCTYICCVGMYSGCSGRQSLWG